jgi:putative pyruvate formate lyase activating enzyme
VSLHSGEEPALSGEVGACNVFLSGCNLHCAFCQNHPISHLGVGRPETPAGLAERVSEVTRSGTRVVNLVTGTHQVPAILEALELILERDPGLTVVWNSGGYEKVETLELLEGIVDVYLPDFKFWDPDVADELASAPDYPEIARRALTEMARQVGPLALGEDGLAERGLIVRHLVLPAGLSGTDHVLGFVARELPGGTAVSLMGQYVPMGPAVDHPRLGRRPSRAEYDEACDLLARHGITTGWTQK